MIKKDSGLDLIKNMFNDTRKMKKVNDEKIMEIAEKYKNGADLYQCRNKEVTAVIYELNDITNEKLDTYKRFGEEIYAETGKIVTIYVIPSVHAKITANITIESEAPLMIKIAVTDYKDTYIVLDHIKDLVKRKQKLDSDDLFALSMIPMNGPEEDRKNLRRECLELWKEINNKGLIK